VTQIDYDTVSDGGGLKPYRNLGIAVFVILSEMKNLMISSESMAEILRLSPQNDIVTQFSRERGIIEYVLNKNS
jgi:hypothetical protein